MLHRTSHHRPSTHSQTYRPTMANPSTTTIPENLKARLKASYDAIAAPYTAWAAKKADIRVSYLATLLSQLPPTHTSVLELGTGAGIPTLEILLAHNNNNNNNKFRVTANELSPAQIALGKARLAEVGVGGEEGEGRVRWVEGDMMGLEFAAGMFDVVLGFYTIQHLPREEQVVMLGRVVEWLRPGGYFLMNFPAEESENVVMTGWMGPEGWMYRSGWGTEKYRELVKGLGLEVLLDEVREDNVKAEFLWIIAKKPEA